MFGLGMKIYTVHLHPDHAHGAEKPVFVREGFSIPAFVLSWVWLAYHRLWVPLIGVAVVYAVVGAAVSVGWLSPQGAMVIQLCLQLWIGLSAHDWQRARLARGGYITADIAAADSLLRAQQRYFERVFT